MQAQTYVIRVGVVINNDGKVLLLKRPEDAQQSSGDNYLETNIEELYKVIDMS